MSDQNEATNRKYLTSREIEEKLHSVIAMIDGACRAQHVPQYLMDSHRSLALTKAQRELVSLVEDINSVDKIHFPQKPCTQST